MLNFQTGYRHVDEQYTVKRPAILVKSATNIPDMLISAVQRGK